MSALTELQKKLAFVPDPVEAPIFCLWGRSGVARELVRAGVRGFSLADVLRGA